ncbi:MAG: hypothetical protein R2695_12695 [Acidimicrobiales bacterium]
MMRRWCTLVGDKEQHLRATRPKRRPSISTPASARRRWRWPRSALGSSRPTSFRSTTSTRPIRTFKDDRWQEHFARLRAEDPVHLNEIDTAGRYWSVTRYDDVRAVDGDWKTYSSAWG